MVAVVASVVTPAAAVTAASAVVAVCYTRFLSCIVALLHLGPSSCIHPYALTAFMPHACHCSLSLHEWRDSYENDSAGTRKYLQQALRKPAFILPPEALPTPTLSPFPLPPSHLASLRSCLLLFSLGALSAIQPLRPPQPCPLSSRSKPVFMPIKLPWPIRALLAPIA